MNAHLISLSGGVSPPKSSPLEEIDAEIPPEDKNAVYYLIILLFVTSTVISTLLTGSFLVASIFLWRRFKHMKFFWFLSLLTLSIFVLSILNLVVNVPATLFSLLTKDFVKSDVFLLMSYIIDVCHYTILFSNLVIAVQRFFVFFFRNLADSVFETPFIYIWMASILLFSLLVVYAMMYNNCRYKYTTADEHYVLNCQTASGINIPSPKGIQTMEVAIQFVLPCLIVGIYIALTAKITFMKNSSIQKSEITILKQAFFVFFVFQISSLVFLFCQTVKFGIVTAFLIKRVINTMEIFAGAATPCFFFFTSKEIRKIVSTKNSIFNSQVNSNSRVPNRQQSISNLGSVA
ncbi:hypothetical protein L3Y34_008356 [Caenorhabditis briggsae]|uniref:G-protein coupled receptors family 1 profile domain-containing protein n=2 Tax=Caenorhabditis briggsae TaxID=6238 RepID=A0AAE9A2H0_CAEBR|nr:hypothetical protein L3Y34_008356 [Caenorhabditis briggsae]